MRKTPIIPAILAFVMLGVSDLACREVSPFEKLLERVAGNLPEINLENDRSFSEDEIEYLDFYGINFQHRARQWVGIKKTGAHKIAMHAIAPLVVEGNKSRARGTVILLHGYLDHAGYFKNIISLLLEMNFNVVAFDLPGHGLSGGIRASIGSFEEYSDVLESVLSLVEGSSFQAPYHLIGHSTGGLAVYNSILHGKLENIESVILLAPLVRSRMWGVSRFAYNVLKHLVSSVPRLEKDNSSDQEFMEFLWNDPLQYNSVPVEWMAACFSWYDRFLTIPSSDRKITVIQGNSDTTLQWEKGLELLQEKFPEAEIHYIEGANHHLHNELPKYRDVVFDLIREKLAGL